jgi:cell division protein FtsB
MHGMANRVISIVLFALLCILQVQIWWGRGSVHNVSKLAQQLQEQRRLNAQARQTNERLSAEVSDLREGLEIVEDRARSELGMVKPNELFIQIIQGKPQSPPTK